MVFHKNLHLPSETIGTLCFSLQTAISSPSLILLFRVFCGFAFFCRLFRCRRTVLCPLSSLSLYFLPWWPHLLKCLANLVQAYDINFVSPAPLTRFYSLDALALSKTLFPLGCNQSTSQRAQKLNSSLSHCLICSYSLPYFLSGFGGSNIHQEIILDFSFSNSLSITSSESLKSHVDSKS